MNFVQILLSAGAVPMGQVEFGRFENEPIMLDERISDLPRSLHHLLWPYCCHDQVLVPQNPSITAPTTCLSAMNPHRSRKESDAVPHGHVTCSRRGRRTCSAPPGRRRVGVTSIADRYSKNPEKEVEYSNPTVRLQENVKRILEISEMPVSPPVYQRRQSFQLSWEGLEELEVPNKGALGPLPDLVTGNRKDRWASIGRELRFIADDYVKQEKCKKPRVLISSRSSESMLPSAALFVFSLSVIGLVSWRVWNGLQ